MLRRLLVWASFIVILVMVYIVYYFRFSHLAGWSDQADYQKSIRTLVHRIEKQQWRPLPFFRRLDSIFLAHREPGLYPSYIQISHFFLEDHIDRPVFGPVKKRLMLKDNNMFTSAIIVEALLETERLGVVELNPNRLRMCIDALAGHRDKNTPDGVPLYCFYCQQSIHGDWKQCPVNIKTFSSYVTTLMPPLCRFLSCFGLNPTGPVWKQAPDIRKMIIDGDAGGFMNRFNMPPDSDDTGLMLSLSTLLKQCPQHHQLASKIAPGGAGIEKLVDVLQKYAYRPFSRDSSRNHIDPRTYYWMRPYLRSQKDKGRDLALFTTWMQHVYEGKGFKNRKTKIPLNMNNVDPTVCAHLLLGLNKVVLYEKNNPAFDEHFQKCYTRTFDLLTWLLENQWSDLNWDIILLYYPTTYHFFWSVSRNLAVLDMIKDRHPAPPPFMLDIRQDLKDVLCGSVSTRLTDMARRDAKTGGLYWCSDFEIVDDRIYCTALVLNTLMEIWTHETGDPAAGPVWRKGTPDAVKSVVAGGAAWLQDALGRRKLPLENLCFSGSIKGYNTVPFLFPVNVREQYGELVIFGMRGTMSEPEYTAHLQEKQAMLKTGVLGRRSKYFTYWTSPVLTQAVAVLALARYYHLGG